MIVEHTLVSVVGEAGALQKRLPASQEPVTPELVTHER